MTDLWAILGFIGGYLFRAWIAAMDRDHRERTEEMIRLTTAPETEGK